MFPKDTGRMANSEDPNQTATAARSSQNEQSDLGLHGLSTQYWGSLHMAWWSASQLVKFNQIEPFKGWQTLQEESSCLPFIMPPTLKKLVGHIAFGWSVILTLFDEFKILWILHARVLKFHIWIPRGKIVEWYFFSCLSYLPFWSYAPLQKSEWSLVSQISRKLFELGTWNLVSW